MSFLARDVRYSLGRSGEARCLPPSRSFPRPGYRRQHGHLHAHGPAHAAEAAGPIPSNLVVLYQRGTHNGSNMGRWMHSYPIYQDFQQKAEPLAEVLCRRLVSASISVDNQTERVEAEMVSGNFFTMLGVKPATRPSVHLRRGRSRRTAAIPSYILSYQYWVNRFDRDPNVSARRSWSTTIR